MKDQNEAQKQEQIAGAQAVISGGCASEENVENDENDDMDNNRESVTQLLLASSSRDKTIRVWDVSSGTQVYMVTLPRPPRGKELTQVLHTFGFCYLHITFSSCFVDLHIFISPCSDAAVSFSFP